MSRGGGLSHPERSFSVLNMRSNYLPAESSTDLNRRARIRDAAIDLVAEGGYGALTARAVAQRAGVSPGSVLHHFGSMGGLRQACDHHVTGQIRAHKMTALREGINLNPMTAISSPHTSRWFRYLVAALTGKSIEVAGLVDELVTDTENYLAEGERIGVIRSSADPRARAVVLTLHSLGALVMHDHLERLLGVDLMASPTDNDGMQRFAAPLVELYREGLLSDTAREAS